MLQNLNLERPLVFFDLETTGVDPASDRIVEISVLRVDPDGQSESRTRRVNPERPIPAGATAIHGIHDEDVADEPHFRQIAKGLLDFIGDADLAGYNVIRFDIPLLERELRDCGLDLRVSQRMVVDAMTIFQRKERRDLTAAVGFFLGKEHEGAHSAEADVAVTAEILEAELERYDDLPRTVSELDRWIRRVPKGALDSSGKFALQDGQPAFTFGKHQGRTLREVAGEHPGYLQWILQSDFPSDAKELVRQVLEQDETPDQST